MRSCTVMLVTALLGGAFLFASGLTPKERMELVRGLTAEYANTKVPLPRGKKGLRLNADGKVDEQSLQREITQFGTASAPSTLVQITAVEIQDKQIVFEINGGGKKKTKWYEHVEVGMGSTTQPIGQQGNKTPTGSSISLVFPKKIEDLTVADVKNYLAPVLDFNPSSPILAVSRPIPPKFHEAIQEKKAEVGMDREMVIAALGQPQRKVREESEDGVEQEDWIYGTPPMRVTFVTFEGDEVVEVQDYEGGIGGAVQSSTDPVPR
ncbi:MAG: hypothetical protein HYX72_06210 [Acidobacteria bacterium]|nr:hypothetical protein [Acidobacteriota bacterium]